MILIIAKHNTFVYIITLGFTVMVVCPGGVAVAPLRYCLGFIAFIADLRVLINQPSLMLAIIAKVPGKLIHHTVN